MTQKTNDLNHWVQEQNLTVAEMITHKRIKSATSREDMALMLGIEVEELALYEEGKASIPASILFLAATFLEGNPLAFFNRIQESNIEYSFNSDGTSIAKLMVS